jgi:hypothetical protein
MAMKEPPSFNIPPEEGFFFSDQYESHRAQIEERHYQAREAFLLQCLAKVKRIENVPSLPLDQLRSFGKVITSTANNNAIGFSWKGKFVSCLCWDQPGYNYETFDDAQFPIQEDSP